MHSKYSFLIYSEIMYAIDKHNNIIERVYKLEQNEAVITQQIKVSNHRIDDLEKIINEK